MSRTIYLTCNSPCIRCDKGRLLEIRGIKDSKNEEVWICPSCNLTVLCSRGVYWMRAGKNLKAYCIKCRRSMETLHLEYDLGKNSRPFSDEDQLAVRIKNNPQESYDLRVVLRGHYFPDLANVLLHVFFEFGEGDCSIVVIKKPSMKFFLEISMKKISVISVLHRSSVNKIKQNLFYKLLNHF